MTTPKRQCNTCEYYFKSVDYSSPYCQFNPPMVSGDHQTGRFPYTEDHSFCSKWEPIWIDNPVLKDAWEEFLMVHKLITCGEEKA